MVISCHYKEQQVSSLSPGEMEELSCLDRGYLDAKSERSQTSCCASQTQSQASELGFPGNKECITLCTSGNTKILEFVDGSYRTSFHLPSLPACDSQLGPFKKLFYLIKIKFIKSKIESYSVKLGIS